MSAAIGLKYKPNVNDFTYFCKVVFIKFHKIWVLDTADSNVPKFSSI